jgi:hypothetical protein
MLSSPTVASQLLVHEDRGGMLNVVNKVGRGLGVAVYQLPFWHYTIPLVAHPRTSQANRWLLLATYVDERNSC